jgi:competence protein ComEC
VGLALAPAVTADPSPAALAAGPLAIAALATVRPRAGRAATGCWLCLVAIVAALGGLLGGGARLQSIDAGALRTRLDAPVRIHGIVAAVPRRSRGEVSVRVETDAGRVLVVAPEPVADLPVGGEVSAGGVLARPEPWREPELRRHGIAMVLRADRLEPESGRRGGLGGEIDRIRERAERALDRGMPEREAALARGFVLGEDDRIDARTREDFRRSNLAHLLAVSGQNVLLLCLLAWPMLALLGLTLRARLIALLLLIAIYVPVTGAGASIQRAGVMGAAGVVAALAGRPRLRWYAVLLAVAATLALNPRTTGDVGWQLSFAAVLGILIWSSRITPALSGGSDRGSARRAAAEGVAVTVAATVATAPLMAHHFDQLSPAALPANVLALPAVAPAMWLGMLAGILGQVPAIPVEPLNWLDSLCLAYIAQIAHWLGSPSWSLIEVRLGSTWAVAAAYAVLLGGMEFLLAWLKRRAGLTALGRSRRAAIGRGRRGRRGSPSIALAIAVGVLTAALLLPRPGDSPNAPPSDHLLVRVLDVGQGDAILLDPPAGDPILVDTGPPGEGIAETMRELGVDSLAAVVITHDQSDHAGGLGELLESVPVARFVYGQLDPRLRHAGMAGGAQPMRLSEGGELRSGALRLTALWPPRELADESSDDPNLLSLVLVAEWRHFSMLLTGDAEAEAVPMDPGPVDLLKVSHHGSEDAGLVGLLDHVVPKLAVISVGDENPYGHPAPPTLAELRGHGVPTLRTDEDGTVIVDVGPDAWGVLVD